MSSETATSAASDAPAPASTTPTAPPPPAEPLPVTACNAAQRRYTNSICAPAVIAVVLAAWLTASTSVRTATPRAAHAGSSAAALQDRIDPNTAPWWELTALPQIGPTIAQRIVAFREDHAAHAASPAFACLADLDRVRGIGPKTLARIGPFLRFAPPPSPPPSPSPHDTAASSDDG